MFFFRPGIILKDRMSKNGDNKKAFVPVNDLEKKLARIGSGRTTPFKGLNFLFNSMVLVLVKPAGEGDASVEKPLMLCGPGREPLLAMFTSPARTRDALERHRDYPAVLKKPGWQVVAGLPADRGLVVNPGCSVGFTIMPKDLQEIRKRFRLENR